MDFSNKVCVVTGGANGIGRCIAENFLKLGSIVACIDMDEHAGISNAVNYDPSRYLFYHGDISEEKVLIDFSRMVKEKFGRVDYLINNACVSKKGILSDCGFDEFNYVLKLGVTAPYMLTKLFHQAFAQNACVINIASTRAFMSQADTESYTAAKGGILTLTHALSISLAGRARVNSISPGWIDTSAYHEGGKEMLTREDELQHPAGRVGVPQDIADMVIFLCSEKAGFITGENVTVDGGMTRQMIYHNDCGWQYSIDNRIS